MPYACAHSPTYLFIVPGALLAAIGAFASFAVLAHIALLGRSWDIHALIGGALLTIIGVQVLALGLCAHAYGTYFMGEKDAWFDRMRARFRLEHGLMLGGAVALLGVAMVAGVLVEWIHAGFGGLSQERVAIAAATLVVVGIQIAFSSFLLSILGLRRREGS